MSDNNKEYINSQETVNGSINKTESIGNTDITHYEELMDKKSYTSQEAPTLLSDADIPTARTVSRKKVNRHKLLRTAFFIGFLVFTFLFVNELFITPYRIRLSIEKTSNLYKPNTTSTDQITAIDTPEQDAIIRITPGVDSSEVQSENIVKVNDPNRDSQGRLLQFNELLAVNEDVKGWITVPQSNIDYVVMQSGSDEPEYYLNHDIKKQELKAGSLFLDYKCSIEQNSQNLTIHGHNMTSTDNMFHYLIKYKELDYYKERPVITFDTVYRTGQWKIFSVFITNGGSEKEELFNYTRPDFSDADDFLEYVYQLRIRSIFNIDTVDINENDQLLTLSTCSYEVKNYRTVIVARKIREGEDPKVDVEGVTLNPEPLYPNSYYYRYGGKAPELTASFEEAFRNREINWYTPKEE